MVSHGHPRFDTTVRSADQPPPPERDGGADPLYQLLNRLVALADYAGHFASAKLDGIRVRVRNIAIAAFAGLVGLIVAIAVVITFCVYLLSGMAGGLSIAVGNRPWLGNLLTGASGLGLIALGICIVALRVRASQRRARVRKYEKRKARQRVRYARDAHNGREAAREHTRDDIPAARSGLRPAGHAPHGS
jgi:hypothetical protein